MATRSAQAFGLTNASVRQDVDLLKPVRLRGTNRVVPRFKTMNARELFAVLRPRLLDSRPVVGEKKTVIGYDKAGRRRFHREPIFGAPTFRNVIEREVGNGKLKERHV